VKEFNLDQPMDKLIDLAINKFGEVEFHEVVVDDISIHVLQIKRMQDYINTLMDKMRSGKGAPIPLWAMIWPSSAVMGLSLSRCSFKDGARVLEIGAGAFVNGLVLAKRGFNVTIVDVDQDALLFSKINALKNGVGDNVSVVHSDFKGSLGARFDCVVGCELLYGEGQFQVLADFLNDHLVEDDSGEIFLSLDLKRVAKDFFVCSDEYFTIMKSLTHYRDHSSGKEKPVNLFRFKRKLF